MSSCGGNSVVTDNLVGSDIDPYGGRTHLSEPVLPFTFSRYSHIGVVMKDTFSAIGHLVNPNVVEEQSEPEEIDGEESKRADPSTISSEVHQGRTNLRRITSKVGTSTVELYQASSRSSASPCLQCPVCRKVIFLRGHLPSGSTAKCDCRVCGLLADGTQLAFVNPNGKGKLMINAGIGAFCRQCRRQSPSPKDTQGATESSTTPNNLVASNNCGQTQAEVQSAPEPVGLNPSPSGVKLERLDEVESVQDGSNELCNLISYQSPEKTVTCPASRCSSVSGLICRICHDPDKPNAPLIAPCRCRGTIEFVHVECLIHWLHYYCQKMRKPPQCELCNYRFRRRKVLRVRNFNLPKCSYRDKMLHIIFLIALLIMVCCAAVTIVFFKYDAVKERSNRQTDGKLSNQEIITLVCGITFFSSFFVAMYAEVKSQVAFYKILARFWDLNREWKIEEYDKSFDAVP